MTIKTFGLLLLLWCADSFSQTRNEIAQQMRTIVNGSSYSSDIQHHKNEMSADANSFAHESDSYLSVAFDRTERFARTTDRYTGIPWKDFDFVGQDKISRRIYVFFSSPIPQTHEVIYGPYFRKDHTDSSTGRTVRSILINIRTEDIDRFHQLCRQLKRLDAGLPAGNPVPAVKTLPSVPYCEKVPPPTAHQVFRTFFNMTEGEECQPEGWPSYQCDLYQLVGVDIAAMQSEAVKLKQHLLAEYWNRYGYSFSYRSHIGQIWNSETTLMETAEDVTYSTGVFLFLGYRLKANVNILNPYTGMTYYDNIAGDYGDEEHTAEPDTEEIGHKFNAMVHAAKRSGLPSTHMLDLIKYDEATHTALVEAVVCNAKGEGIFSGLAGDPAQFMAYLHNIGLRNFDEAVFLFENIYQTTLTAAQKAQFRTTIAYRNMAWDPEPR
ncbi:MAG: hypothetical protein K0M63_05725 [Weeksellaceae bacterium]|nr:hypothetical protein [Weeksellaceae bacterium]